MVSSKHIASSELEAVCEAALLRLGYAGTESNLITQVLMYAQLRGNSQNVMKISAGALTGPAGISREETRVIQDGPLSIQLDGGKRLGMLVVETAVKEALTRCQERGFGIAGTCNTSSSTGALGFWAKQIAEAGYIGVVLSQSPEYVAPHGASQAVFGTNPIAVAIPTETEPMVLDMATSAYAWYDLLKAKNAGQAVPEDVGFNAQGQPTTDPGAILAGGAIRSFDRSHKGSHLALLVEMLTGALASGAVTHKATANNWANLVVALDPALLGPTAGFRSRASTLLAAVKAAIPLPDGPGVWLPGERGDANAARCLESGTVPVDPQILADIKAMAEGQLPEGAVGTPVPAARLANPLEAAAKVELSSTPCPPTTGRATGETLPEVAPNAAGVQLEGAFPDLQRHQGNGAVEAALPAHAEAPEVAQDATGVQFEEIFPAAQWHQDNISEDNVHQLGSPPPAAQAAGSGGSRPADSISTAEASTSGEHTTEGRDPRRPTMATRLCHPPRVTDDPYGSMSPPLYQTATFHQQSAVECGPYDYSRSGNPTRDQLQAHIAELEGAHRAFAFGSGMAALSTVLRLVPSGGHIVAGRDLYGGTSRLLARVAPNLGITVSHVDTANPAEVEAAFIDGRTKLLMLETPTNPKLDVCDIRGCCDIASKAGVLVVVDNSIMAPVFQQPLALGADISMTSATKFIAGHSDVTGGLLAVKDPQIAEQIYFFQNAEGSALGPFDCWLSMRGLKTMALRMERQAATCALLASALHSHPLISRVNYPGLPNHPAYALHSQQASSGGSLLSFETGSVEASRRIVEQTKLFKVTVSFGSVTSLISLPCYMSHASIPAEVRAARGLPDDLIRISAGIEDPDDLLADLDQAIQSAMEAVGQQPVPLHSPHKPPVDFDVTEQQRLQQRVKELEGLLAQSQMSA
ncbi:hypothetical protein WJX84_000978 [Apatococcus fuscideae]|uniref:cysteine-S-conjugate beta-lyase n=1 Tax=Apatococcus fuscideae TaxID=2026836 RepID=A0AAW1SVS6_9CHLO